MKQELKIRIHNHEKLEKQLQEIRATFIKETHFVDTYFNAPKENVLKIGETDEGAFIVRFTEKNGKFDVGKKEKIADLDKTREQFLSKHGLHKILKGTRKEYIYNDLELTFNLIDGVGEFLIVTSEEGQDAFIKDVLKIQNPEYIRTPFSEV